MEIKLQELFTLAKKEDMMMFCMEYAEGNMRNFPTFFEKAYACSQALVHSGIDPGCTFSEKHQIGRAHV